MPLASKKTRQQLDLSQLAVDRTAKVRPKTARGSTWLTRFVLPIGLFSAFAFLFIWSARDSFLPTSQVTITPVVVSRAEVKREGTTLFQAAGWIEPRPTPVIASSLAAGVIDEVLIIEGQCVEKGEPIATLIDIDARLALGNAEAEYDLQEAELQRSEATLTAARTNLAKPVELQAALGDAEARVAETELNLVGLPFAIKAAKTLHSLALDNLRRKEQAGDAVPGRLLREAQAELAVAINAADELVARKPALKAALVSLRNRRDALATKLNLLTDEKRAVAVSEASLAAANARLQQKQLAVDAAQLRIDRMIVRSPISGRVLSLEARPGQRLSGINPHSAQGSSAVASLYDPASLQVRVDVRLENVPQVQIGQSATIETAAAAKPIAGKVISVTTRADIQKNTLQVKVAIIEPPDVIKPEMLAKVVFLAPASPVASLENGEAPLRLFVPEALVIEDDGGASVWVADLTEASAHRKHVNVGNASVSGNLVEITSGLSPTDKLIVAGRESLSEGARIRVNGEDKTL